VTEATSRDDWWNKWGKHYLTSLIAAHTLQLCHNLKDPGVQHYGGALFRSLRDAAEKTFLQLPPPVPYNSYSLSPAVAYPMRQSSSSSSSSQVPMASAQSPSSTCRVSTTREGVTLWGKHLSVWQRQRQIQRCHHPPQQQQQLQQLHKPTQTNQQELDSLPSNGQTSCAKAIKFSPFAEIRATGA